MSRIAWVPDFGTGPELYQQVEVAEPGDPGWPGADLPEGDPWAPAVNQLRAEIAADYAGIEAAAREAEYEAEWADEWDSADSNAYQDRVEADLEPEAGPAPEDRPEVHEACASQTPDILPTRRATSPAAFPPGYSCHLRPVGQATFESLFRIEPGPEAEP